MRLALSFILLFALAIGLADRAALAQISFTTGYAHPNIGASRPGVAYLTLENHGTADKLLGVRSPRAEKIEIHTHIMQDSIMKMRRLEKLNLPARQITAMQPHGHHLMLFGLTPPLQAGDTMPLDLIFEKHPPLHISLPVIARKTADKQQTRRQDTPHSGLPPHP